MKLPQDFKELLEEFGREKVECVVVGGYAFAYHARPRATKDLDLLIGGAESNLARAARALEQFGAPGNVVEAVRNLGVDEVAYFGRPPLRIDILRTIDGVTTADVLEHSVRAKWDGVDVRVIAFDDLVANKRAAARPQDLADAATLERMRKPKSG